MKNTKQTTQKINPRVDRAWFKAKLKERGETQVKLARYLEVDASAITLLLNGKRRLQLAHAEKIAQFLKVPKAEVLRHVGMDIEQHIASSQDERRVPIVGRIDTEGTVHLVSQPGTVPVPTSTPSNARALRMEGGFAPGGAVVFHPAHDIEIEAIGRLSIVGLHDGGYCLGVPTAAYERGYFNVSLPKSNLDGIEIKTATPVLWIRP